jgi:hypothetical protein
MNPKDILERDKNGELISLNDPEYYKIRDLIVEAQKITMELNNSYHEAEEVRTLFSRLTGAEVDASFGLLPPFYTDFGKNIRVGKNVFINHACTFMDRGGITIGDNVLVGPKVNLITINHPLDPAKRQSTISTPNCYQEERLAGSRRDDHARCYDWRKFYRIRRCSCHQGCSTQYGCSRCSCENNKED